MSQPTIPFSQQQPSPSLRDLLVQLKLETQKNTNCHAIGTIKAFRLNDNTGFFESDVQISYCKTVYVLQSDGTSAPQQLQYPLLVQVPTLVMGGSGAALQIPAKPGDQCLVLYNDQDLSNWYAGARTGPVATNRTHSFTDAMCIVGFVSAGSFDPDYGSLTNGNAEVSIPIDGSGTVKIANDITSLYTVLSNLVTVLESLTVIIPAGTINPATLAALQGIQAQLDMILE